MIWIAYNGWLGNGRVAVIVEADDEESARAKAVEAFMSATPGHADEDDYSFVTTCESIELPYVTEIG